MKKLSIFVMLAATLSAASAALPQPDLIAQAYFAGAQKIFALPNVNVFTNEFCSAPAMALRKQTADKLAVWLAGWLQQNTGSTVVDGATRLRPLFDDLQQSEWLGEAREVAGKSEVALVIRLDTARMQAWQAGLKPFLPAASFTTSGGWLIFDSSAGGLGNILAQKAAQPPDGWFSLDANWPRLAQWLPEAGRLGPPETQFDVSAKGTSFSIVGKFIFPQPLAIKLDPWKFPTNLVHEPFNSFTAVRGFSSWLSSQTWEQPWPIVPVPNQAFIWTGQGLPFGIYVAAPVSDPMSALSAVYSQVELRLEAERVAGATLFPLSAQKNDDSISFLGLPMTAPYIKAVNGPSGRFMFAGGVPELPSRKQIPPEFFARLNTANLVLYHWEVTPEQVANLLQPMQLGLLETGHLQLNGNSAAYKWLENITSQLGSTETEITCTGADQFTFNRTAPGIFTAAELYALANWLEAKNFPGCDLKAPPMRMHRPHPKITTLSVPAVPARAPAPK